MPPSMVHVNGSVNLDDAETVMRELSRRVPGLRRIPDGETGERRVWIAFQSERFQAAAGLEPVPREEGRLSEIDEQTVRVVDGTEPMDIRWPDLGFAAFYRESWLVFRRLQEEGAIVADVRLQVEYPSPLACVATYVNRADAASVLPSYERALFADLDRLLAVVSRERVAVQFDLPVEMGALEMPDAFAICGHQDLATVAADVARCVDHVPVDVPVGLHLCYGDYLHRHWKEPESMETQVRLLNAVLAAAQRPVSWCAFTVPQYARDRAFYAPLADLTPSDTELYLSLVPYRPADQQPGTTEEQVRLIDEILGERPWGISAECGLANVDRDELPTVMDLHNQILRRFAAASLR